MSTRYQFFQQASLDVPSDLSIPLSVPAMADPVEILIYSADSLGSGILSGIPFHTDYSGDLLIDIRVRANVVVELVTRHRLADGVQFDSSRVVIVRIASNEIFDLPLARFSTVTSARPGAMVNDHTSGLDVGLTSDQFTQATDIDILLRVSGYEFADLTTRADVTFDAFRLERGAVAWWQLYATLDRPPESPPVPRQDVSGSDPRLSPSQALLRIQSALVSRFAAVVGGPSGVLDAFVDAGVPVPDPQPDPILYDEPPSGVSSSYWRLGTASVQVETRAGGVYWEIDQEIEAHVDPVRGRAAALVMGDLMERAFAAGQTIGAPPHTTPGLDRDPWMGPAALALRDVGPSENRADSASPIRVVDIRQTDSRIGWSEAGLTYQVIGTWSITAEPI